MFFIIQKQEVSDNLGDFLGDKCKIKRGEQFIFEGDSWDDISSEMQQDAHEFFDGMFVYTANAVDYLLEKNHDPIQAAAQFCEDTGFDCLYQLNASIVASHFFINDILSELYNIEPTEKEFLYKKQEVKLINHKKGINYAII
jgi:hypothetical protein